MMTARFARLGRPSGVLYPARLAVAALLLTGFASTATAQPAPVNGMRPAEVRHRAIVGATVIPSPGARLENATILMRDGVIVAVGEGIDLPAGVAVTDGTGLTVYPGLIDAALAIPVDGAADMVAAAGGAHWNARVRPQLAVADLPTLDAGLRKAMRELGFVVAGVYPNEGIFRGRGAVLALADEPEHVVAHVRDGAMAIGLEYGGRREGYPASLMGSAAMIRQTLLDAQWHAERLRIAEANPGRVEPPARADALTALRALVAGEQTALVDVRNEHDALLAASILEEFEIRGILLGSGLEFRRLDEIAATGLPVIAPLSFPQVPEVNDTRQSETISLTALINWEQAPTNPRRLIGAGVRTALTTHGLDDRKTFWTALEQALEQGLSTDDALAALTTVPAQLLGVDAAMGTIAPGKAANLVVVDGELFVRTPKIRAVWVNGRSHDVTPANRFPIRGAASVRIGRGGPWPATLDPDENRLSIVDGDGKRVQATRVSFERDRVAFVIDGAAFDVTGPIRCVGVVVDGEVLGDGETATGRRFPMVITADDVGNGPADEPRDEEGRSPRVAPEIAFLPMGDGGRVDRPETRDILIEGATLWTCGPEGRIDRGWILLRNGRIEAIGEGERAPIALRPRSDEGLVLDARGRHVTPGLIDCHSHTGIRGGVNESTKASTAEVRIVDSIEPDDVNWLRQLAGGMTTVSQLHGSANPIGGQNSVVKIRWGEDAARFRFDADGRSVPGGIKFALGENVVRSRTRYPNTRMGVEAFLLDRFTAAAEMRDAFARYDALPARERAVTMPPRRDLELEALVEVLEGTRLVHCHSYRQDEILMLLRLAERFDFRIGTLQHILEGYKVADAIADHGAAASSFSDWWGYKVEVQDAIPDNGAIMHRLGIDVSFNSDSNEVARRMNIEAAKAVRYGGLDPEDALAFVTINPARQLGIDDRVGSLEVGKDADVVIWSGHPLSTMSRCEMTIIDGAIRFDRDADSAHAAALSDERARLVALASTEAERLRTRTRRERRQEEAREEGIPEATSPPAPEHRGARGRLLARMLDGRVDALLGMIRDGIDPEEIRPGECGCGMATVMLNELIQENSR